MPTYHGIVKWFNVSIGYGFIASCEDGTELFVHGNSCQRGFLVNGERVVFDVADGDASRGKTRNRQAVRVRADGAVVPSDHVAARHERLVVTTQSIVC